MTRAITTAHVLARLRRLPWRILGPVGVYAVLVLLGVTMSSAGIPELREDPAHPQGIQLGSSLRVRSDEFLTSMPMNLGVAATGTTQSLNPLTAQHGFSSQLSSGPVSTIVLFDGTLLRLGPLLPDQWVIAARWWTPFLLLFLGAPAFFRNLTGNSRIGWFAAALMVASPASAWWSFGPVTMLGFTIAGVAAMQNAAARWGQVRHWTAVGWAAVAAVLLARTPLHYQPWAIVVATAVVLVGIVGLVAGHDRRWPNAAMVGAVGASAVVLLGGVVLENWQSVQATLHTLYPGARVATGGASPLQEIFGAPFLGRLEYMTVTGPTNASEISSSFAVAAIWAVLLLVRGTRPRDGAHRAAIGAAMVATTFWFSWALVDYGNPGYHIPIVNLVPPQRAADVLGYLGILLACLVLPAFPRRSPWTFALVSAGVVAMVTANAGSLLRGANLPGLSVRQIWITTALLALVVFVITSRARWWPGYVLAVMLAASLVYSVNPVLFGLGDLRGTPSAERMLQTGDELRQEGKAWVSDDAFVDSLMIATGVPSLSGRQLAGPNADAWRALDPGGDEAVWNRGGSFIWFSWSDDPDLQFSNPSPDVIRVEGSPCTVAQRVPELSGVVASHPLNLPCLRADETFTWGGVPRYVYAVESAG